MSHWNYRIIKKANTCPLTKDEEPFFHGIYEVYYDDEGKIIGCTVQPVDVVGETVDGVLWVLEKMREAANKPVLDWDIDIPKCLSNDIIDDLDFNGAFDAEDGC